MTYGVNDGCFVESPKNGDSSQRGMIKRFIDTCEVDEELLQYSAGIVAKYGSGFIVTYQQKGAEETFSIGQPVYDRARNKLGYLGLGMYKNLDYSGCRSGELIPCECWSICNPTSYCKHGVAVYTYWQTFGSKEMPPDEKREDTE